MNEKIKPEIIKEVREILMAPWNPNNTFVIFWGYGDGSNIERNNSEKAQNQIGFGNTEKCQIDAIGKIVGLKDYIHPYQQPKNWKTTYQLAWSDQILSNYLSDIGFNIRKSTIGADFPNNFPNELMDVAAYALWLADGGIAVRNYINQQIYFFACERFLIDFQRELEKHVNFPGNVGKLRKSGNTSLEVVDLWELVYGGIHSFRILSEMFKRTKSICDSLKRDKAINLVSNYTNIVLDRQEKRKQPQAPFELKVIAALYDAMDLMKPRTRQRYLRYCGSSIDEIRDRAEANWYLRK